MPETDPSPRGEPTAPLSPWSVRGLVVVVEVVVAPAVGTVDDEGIYRVYDAKIIAKAPADPRQGELEELSTDHTTGAFDVILETLLDGVKDSGGKLYLQDEKGREQYQLKYINKKKISEWSQATRLESPTAEIIQRFKKIVSTEADLVKLKTENPTLYQGGGSRSQPQGFTNRSDRGITITLTPRANKSTFLHEMGHLFLWDLEALALSGKADPRTSRDWAEIKKCWSDHAEDLAGWISMYGKLSDDLRDRFLGDDAADMVRRALNGEGNADCLALKNLPC